jgi:hypothetical protein
VGKSYRQGLERQDLAATRPGRIIAIIVIDIDCSACGNISRSANIDGDLCRRSRGNWIVIIDPQITGEPGICQDENVIANVSRTQADSPGSRIKVSCSTVPLQAPGKCRVPVVGVCPGNLWNWIIIVLGDDRAASSKDSGNSRRGGCWPFQVVTAVAVLGQDLIGCAACRDSRPSGA